MIVNWEKIDTVLLDMDGTLLDLNFDNHFWNEFVPLKFAEKNGISLTLAKQQLKPQFKSMEGRLEWYCLDYWSQELQLDITGLKAEISRLISVLPHVTEFLEKLQQTSKKVLLVTNAHPYSLELKMEKTCLQLFFDEIISSHDLGAPKESREFWELLLQKHVFDINTTLLIDDSVSVLKAAQLYGIKYLISISKPDSKMPIKDVIGYPAIEDFKTLIFGL
jgi:putative hydrolase of the HAD superfamily